jgi:hypothetical protein
MCFSIGGECVWPDGFEMPSSEPKSPFGPNRRAFVVYLRAVQGIPMARLSHVLKDLFGVRTSCMRVMPRK